MKMNSEKCNELAKCILESIDSAGFAINWNFEKRYLDAIRKGIMEFQTASDDSGERRFPLE